MRISDWSSDVCSSDLIILDRDEAEIAAIARPRWTGLDRLLPEADPAVGQIGADVLRRQQQGTAFAMEERREELQRFGAWSGLALINPQQRRLIAPERRHQRLARRIELAQIVRGGLDRRTRAAELVAQAIEQAHAP